MNWLSNPKVRLALIVNGLYLISLFTPATPHTRPRLFARTYKSGDFSVPAPKRAPVHVTLPPPSGPSKAAALPDTEPNQLYIDLTNDLTLVERHSAPPRTSSRLTARVRW